MPIYEQTVEAYLHIQVEAEDEFDADEKIRNMSRAELLSMGDLEITGDSIELPMEV